MNRNRAILFGLAVVVAAVALMLIVRRGAPRISVDVGAVVRQARFRSLATAGYWPARRAARLNPVDALRHE